MPRAICRLPCHVPFLTHPQQELDLLFLFDITGSMGGAIGGVKSKATNLVDSIKRAYADSVFRTGFVGYRLVSLLEI